MNLYKITDGCEFIQVFAANVDRALKMPEVRDYFCDFTAEEFLNKVKAERIVKDMPVTVDLDGHKITLTAEEWYLVNPTQRVLSASQY